MCLREGQALAPGGTVGEWQGRGQRAFSGFVRVQGSRLLGWGEGARDPVMVAELESTDLGWSLGAVQPIWLHLLHLHPLHPPTSTVSQPLRSHV